MIQIIDENIVDSDTMIIAHQCNCTSTGVSGVAAAIFDKWPAANDNARGSHGAFGATNFHEVEPGKFIANIFAQQYPSVPGQPGDGKYARAKAFEKGLKEITLYFQGSRDLRPTIALPYLVGCGSAGGDWDVYQEILEAFAKDFERTCKGSVVLYRYTP